MKVYVVEITWCMGCDFGSTVKSFSNYKSAKAEFESEFKQSKIDFDGKDNVVEKSENNFSMYEYGHYSINHVDGKIVETEVLD